MRKYQILERKGKKFEEVRGAIPFSLPVNELMEGVREHVEAFAERAGLELMRLVVEEERSHITEGSGARGYRWASQPGYAVWNGRKVAFPNLRVRTRDGRKEIPLKSYRRFQADGEMSRLALRDLMRGVSSRNYEGGVEGMLRGYGFKKSSVSRQFIAASAGKLRDLMERDLKPLDLAAILVDGIGFGDHLLVAAIGVDMKGEKHALGLWQGATENAAVSKALLEDLVRRGLNPERKYLFVIDGSKALRSAINKVFGTRAAVQRCQEHKKRNVAGHLPDELQGEFRRRMNAAYAMTDYKDARNALLECVRSLERINPSAAASLKEGMEETLTLHELGLPESLRKSLTTTNIIESAFSTVRNKTGRVKRWSGGDQAQRWAASALLWAEKSWRRIKGFRQMPQLAEALKRWKNLEGGVAQKYNGEVASAFN